MATATVSEILEERRYAGEPPAALLPILSILAHGLFLLALAYISRPKPMAVIPQAVPVRVVSAASLSRPAPGPAVAKPEAAKAKPVIEKVEPEKPVPSAKAMPEAKDKKAKPEKEKPKAQPAAKVAEARPSGSGGPPALELPSAGAASGEVGGTSSFGTSVSSFDADFPFSYYVEQLLSLIGANWLKPNAPDGTFCVLTFRIQRTGQVTDVKVESPSAYSYYDRAASRALYAANPLPPLPPEFKGDQLGVHLRFQ
ncbi:MAG TPA: TonB family protein [Thermoanaerobaculia bacterium]|jgi:TonB family protein|nr:TonB family protein [Thermoanaerobaculia bacterium]